MADFATPAWIDELSARLAAVTLAPSDTITFEQRVTGPPDAVWHVEVVDGRVSAGTGPHPDPTVRITVDRATAEAIHAGRRSAQRAFLDGDLRIGGDIEAFLGARELLDTLFSSARTAT